MEVPAAGHPQTRRTPTPPATLSSTAAASTGSPPARIENRPLHGQPTLDPVACPATPTNATAGVAEARDAHFADLMRATPMRPMVAAVYDAMPSAQTRLVAFGQWAIQHADALGTLNLAPHDDRGAASELMAKLPMEGPSAHFAATAYVTVLFNTILPDPETSDTHAVTLLRIALSGAQEQAPEVPGAPG